MAKATPAKRKRKGKPGKKQCDKCGKIWGVRKKACSCGYEFPAKTTSSKIKTKATDNANNANNLIEKLVDEMGYKTLVERLGQRGKINELIDVCGGADAATEKVNAFRDMVKRLAPKMK